MSQSIEIAEVDVEGEKNKFISIVSTTIGSGGRLCNQIIRNILFSKLAKKYNLKIIYGFEESMKKLGIDLFKDGTVIHPRTILLHDDDFLRFLNCETLQSNIMGTCTYFQNQANADYLKGYFKCAPIKQNIMEKNKYHKRYDNNNDVFIHVRLDDAVAFNPGCDYYEKVLNGIPYDKGFISSDTIEHPICQKLISKYNLTPIEKDEVETIMFGSTCRYIVLSNGTFSWFIGVIGWYSTVFYPDPELTTKWHGDIFNFNDWNKIKL